MDTKISKIDFMPKLTLNYPRSNTLFKINPLYYGYHIFVSIFGIGQLKSWLTLFAYLFILIYIDIITSWQIMTLLSHFIQKDYLLKGFTVSKLLTMVVQNIEPKLSNQSFHWCVGLVILSHLSEALLLNNISKMMRNHQWR